MPRQMDHKEIREIREQLLIKQDNICPLCNCVINSWEAALDHDHETGLIRGVIHLRCNSCEGGLKSKFKRSGCESYTDFSTYLYNLSVYLSKEHYDLLHPSNKPGPKKIMKSSYNKLIKEIKRTNIYYKSKKKKPIKYPGYPKSKRLTKRLKELFEEFAIDPQFYTKVPKDKK